jgi:hypothetical protein
MIPLMMKSPSSPSNIADLLEKRKHKKNTSKGWDSLPAFFLSRQPDALHAHSVVDFHDIEDMACGCIEQRHFIGV